MIWDYAYLAVMNYIALMWAYDLGWRFRVSKMDREWHPATYRLNLDVKAHSHRALDACAKFHNKSLRKMAVILLEAAIFKEVQAIHQPTISPGNK